MVDRRSVMIGLGGAALLPARAFAASPDAFAAAIADIEARSGGRLGVALFDSATGRPRAWRGGERFPICSTFKWLLAAAVLRRFDAGEESLDRIVEVPAASILSNSPFSRTRVGQGASVAALCEAAIIHSDNSAANLLLPAIGGPAGLTGFARTMGDRVTRLDRYETALGEATPGDPRDTTSPLAMLGLMRRLLLGSVLRPESRARLIGWLVDNRTGGAKIRAGLPPAWRIGDKTGGGEHGSTNDVAIIWPERRAPLLLTAYLTEPRVDVDGRNAALAAVGRAVATLY